MNVSSVFFTFKDFRNDEGKGYVIGPGERIFNHRSNDTNHILRDKFIEVFFGNIPSGVLLKFTTKSIDFLTGGSFLRGYKNGVREWQLHRLLTIKEEHQKGHDLGKTTFIAKCVLMSLVKDVVKIATFPLYLVGMQLAAAIGICFPLDGWVFTCRMEEMWDQNIQARLPKVRCIVHLLYTAPCMQSKRTWERQNLYRLCLPNYCPNTSRSLKLRFSNLLEESIPYLDKETIALGNQAIARWRQLIPQVSPPDEIHDAIREVDDKGNSTTPALDKCIAKFNASIVSCTDQLGKYVKATNKALEEGKIVSSLCERKLLLDHLKVLLQQESERTMDSFINNS